VIRSEKSLIVRKGLAEMVIARKVPIKRAAFELGLSLANADYHMLALRQQITRSTNRLMNLSRTNEPPAVRSTAHRGAAMKGASYANV
jgi:hypothetical protein